jgi:integrase
MRVLFWLYKSRVNKNGETPIWVRITNNTEREQFTTGLSVVESSWNQDKQAIRGRDELTNSLNKQLNNIKLALVEQYTKLSSVNPATSVHDVKLAYLNRDNLGLKLIDVFELHNSRIKKLLGKEYSVETYLIYDRTLRNVQDFIWHRYKQRDIYLVKLKRSFVEEYIYYLKTERKHEINTVFKNVQRLNTVFNFAVSQYMWEKNVCKGVNVRHEKKEILYLTTEELTTMEEKTFSIGRLEVVRNMFLFQCYTGLAYRELKELRAVNITKRDDGEIWIVAKRQKTGRTFKVPLLPQAERIYHMYRTLSLDPTKPIFPVPSNQKFNAYLKEVGDLCSINKELTTHLGRKTFATTVTLLNGVPMETVSALLGHSSIKITQEAYSKVGDAKLSRDMGELRKRFA